MGTILQATFSSAFSWKQSVVISDSVVQNSVIVQGPVLLTLLRHVARILANGRAAFFESCDTIGWNSCDVSQKR